MGAIVLGREKPYRPIWLKSSQSWIVKACSKELYALLRKPNVEHCERCMATNS